MSDPRFARLKSDPRFRRPKKKLTKVIVDERFKSVFAKEKKKHSNLLTGPKVDKYGRPVPETQEQDDLKRFYRLNDGSDDEEEEPKKIDLARGEVLLESSDEEDEDEAKNDSDNANPRGGPSQPKTSLHSEDSGIDLDENNLADLEQQAETYSKDHQEEETQEGPRTARLAIVNLDWDHVRAHHLYKICASLVSPTAPLVRASTSSVERRTSHHHQKSERGDGAGQVNVVRGKVLNIRVYPSEFGKERMSKEEKEGPPPEIFKKKDLAFDEVDEKNVYDVGGEDDYDEDALRKYQLERLRYYYAIVTCDTPDAASHIYNELEGSELERSANVFDLSFVPDDMSFDGEPRDEATGDLNTTFKGVDFVTDALRHSKVKLTWDGDDPQRNQVTRRALTRKEIEESDFKAYIANTSSESESDAEDKPLPSKKDKKASREKLRALLLGGNDEAIPEGWGDDGAVDDVDMEITFTPGLSDKKNKEDETTLDRYQRKMKEKRKKKKEEVTSKREEGGKKLEDDFFEQASDEEAPDEYVDGNRYTKGQPRKSKKTVDRKDSSLRPEVTAEELALLVASDNPNTEPKHFNIKSVIKAEKQKNRKKGWKAKGDVEVNETQEDFILDVKDERFKALHEDHQFAIDPSNPHFKKTKSMAALLEERQKRQREIRGNEMDGNSAKSRKVGVSDTRSLQSLVESVKRKSVQSEMPGQGKRRKL
ncbi:hypothetical protein BYT27DRAFT_7097591 [Phlegmacium glaucopus]|nr:hypothetical protein BYT27DRAFT_7097591 [Phlegmacium glaucopus]